MFTGTNEPRPSKPWIVASPPLTERSSSPLNKQNDWAQPASFASPTSPIQDDEILNSLKPAVDVYQATLPWWRAAVRRKLVQIVEWESEAIARMQRTIRTPWLDAYFVYTSSLGTHTCFMIVLPALYFFGFAELGRGLLIILAFGVYVSSFIKDLICSPRPFAPPVARLTIGTHHLEYGFPSTHSTNSVSIALFFLTHVRSLAFPQDSIPSISETTYYISVGLLSWYMFSIVFGRLYTAMHGFTDCAMGVLLGTAIWALHEYVGKYVDVWVRETGWAVPLTVVPLALLMVHQHPQPVDDCPCFEDAIAFISVVLGSMLSQWHAVRYGFDETSFKTVMPGSSWEAWADISVWWTVVILKMVVGILAIFIWRIAAKSMLHVLLPPIFRLLAQGFTLPHRRFYTPATDYKSLPSEFGSGGLLRPIPSVIDLPSELEMEVDAGWDGQERSSGRKPLGVAKMRTNGHWNGAEKSVKWELEGNAIGGWDGYANGKDGEVVKHYDADVLTKVIVYCGIAVLVSEGLPLMFEVWGWGINPWP